MENKHGDKEVGNKHNTFFGYFKSATREIHIGLEGKEMHKIDFTRTFLWKKFLKSQKEYCVINSHPVEGESFKSWGKYKNDI